MRANRQIHSVPSAGTVSIAYLRNEQTCEATPIAVNFIITILSESKVNQTFPYHNATKQSCKKVIRIKKKQQ